MTSSYTPPRPRIRAIATAVPGNDVHGDYSAWGVQRLADTREAAIFRRMVERGGIAHRHSVLTDEQLLADLDASRSPGTGARMQIYTKAAPQLALQAIAGLPSTDGITHIVLASCTGFMAPGLDQVIAREMGLDASVERVVIGFMGCYAGVTAMRTAGHIVRSAPDATVLVVCVELCTLHCQETDDLESLLAMGQFADGASAAIVTAHGEGLAIDDSISLTLDDSAEAITWTIGDTGFVMHLSGSVPGKIADILADPDIAARITGGRDASTIDAWAVHPGGRSVLDGVERGLALPKGKLAASRDVLRRHGNMSSATVLFVLRDLMKQQPATGLALAFGPGLAVEGLRLGWTDDAG